jgi:hypothetical protein
MTTDPLELLIELELKSVEEQLNAFHQRMQQLEQEQAEAMDAEGQALDAARAAHEFSDPMIWQTGLEHVQQQDQTHVIQVGVVVGDTLWRMHHPEAAEALGWAAAMDQAARAATAHVINLARLHEELEYHHLPQLNAALDRKQKELAAHQEAQERAREHVATRGTWLQEFRKTIRGDL